jgi:hypothetical protein
MFPSRAGKRALQKRYRLLYRYHDLGRKSSDEYFYNIRAQEKREWKKDCAECSAGVHISTVN